MTSTKYTDKTTLRLLFVAAVAIVLMVFSVSSIAESVSEYSRGDGAGGIANALIALGCIKLIFSF